ARSVRAGGRPRARPPRRAARAAAAGRRAPAPSRAARAARARRPGAGARSAGPELRVRAQAPAAGGAAAPAGGVTRPPGRPRRPGRAEVEHQEVLEPGLGVLREALDDLLAAALEPDLGRKRGVAPAGQGDRQPDRAGERGGIAPGGLRLPTDGVPAAPELARA